MVRFKHKSADLFYQKSQIQQTIKQTNCTRI